MGSEVWFDLAACRARLDNRYELEGLVEGGLVAPC